MAFKPLHDRVVVRRVQGEEKTKGGLIIPDNAIVPSIATKPPSSCNMEARNVPALPTPTLSRRGFSTKQSRLRSCSGCSVVWSPNLKETWQWARFRHSSTRCRVTIC